MVSRARKMMKGIVPKLEAAGWRVRRGGWPCTLVAEARWDFCVTESGSLFAMVSPFRHATRNNDYSR
jgi:hypothetical protein